MSYDGDITFLLTAVKRGDPQAEAELIARVYSELHALAVRQMRSERPDHTLQPTALVNEAYVRLLRQQANTPQNRSHFFATASAVMRRVLVDYARTRRAVKRGAGAERVVLEDILAATAPRIEELLIIDDLLTQLAEFAPACARVVELTYFGGLSFKEAAAALNPPVSERTAKRYQREAHNWLKLQISRDRK